MLSDQWGEAGEKWGEVGLTEQQVQIPSEQATVCAEERVWNRKKNEWGGVGRSGEEWGEERSRKMRSEGETNEIAN